MTPTTSHDPSTTTAFWHSQYELKSRLFFTSLQGMCPDDQRCACHRRMRPAAAEVLGGWAEAVRTAVDRITPEKTRPPIRFIGHGRSR